LSETVSNFDSSVEIPENRSISQNKTTEDTKSVRQNDKNKFIGPLLEQDIFDQLAPLLDKSGANFDSNDDEPGGVTLNQLATTLDEIVPTEGEEIVTTLAQESTTSRVDISNGSKEIPEDEFQNRDGSTAHGKSSKLTTSAVYWFQKSEKKIIIVLI